MFCSGRSLDVAFGINLYVFAFILARANSRRFRCKTPARGGPAGLAPIGD
jgi:hypothetical protein